MADAADGVRKYDLIPRLSPFLDRHLVLPLLEFLEGKNLYPEDEIRRAKLQLLAPTNMVDFVSDIYTSLYPGKPVPSEVTQKREEVMATLTKLLGEAAPVIELASKPDVVRSLKESGNLNKMAYLSEHHNVTDAALKAFYALAKHVYECGDYTKAGEYLTLFREMTTDVEMANNAIWGKLATNILMEQWDVALKDVAAVKEIVEARAFANPTTQLQQRTWMLHWLLPLFFNSPESRQQLLEIYQHEKTWQVVQTSCPHLLRYIIVASVISKRRFPKEIVKMVDQESYVYSDPITKFIETLYGPTDFEGAEAQLTLCASVLDNDPYLHLVKNEFLEASRLLIFELFCKLHNCIDTRLLASKLNMSHEESEKWIVNLIRGAKLDAKIDTQANQVIIGSQAPALYQQLIDRTRSLVRPLAPIPGPKKFTHRAETQKETKAVPAE